MKEFIDHILKILNTNGFPQKRVSLPTEKMYEAADNKGFSFNQVLEELKTSHNVDAQIGPDKIIFSQAVAANANTNMNKEEMMKQAQEMMSKMSPEELKRMQEMFMNMTPEEKEEIMKKGKDLGWL